MSVIIGGGQSGLVIAFGLLRSRVSNIVVLDENPAGLEGPWVTYGRMITLRTLKFLTGPDLGIPALTYRAWHEAQFGPGSWAGLGAHPAAGMDALPRVAASQTSVCQFATAYTWPESRASAVACGCTLADGGMLWTRKLFARPGSPAREGCASQR